VKFLCDLVRKRFDAFALLFVLAYGVLASGCGTSLPTGEPQMGRDQLVSPLAHYHFLSYLNETGERIFRFFSRIAYDDVVFVLDTTGRYRASYAISVDFFNDESIQDYVTGRTIERSLTTASYAETNSLTKFDTTDVPLSVVPGTYYVVIRLVDHNSGRESFQRSKVRVKDFSGGGIVLSSVFLLSSSAYLPQRTGKYESLDEIADLSKNFVAAVEMKANRAGSARVQFSVVSGSGGSALDSTIVTSVDSGQILWESMEIPSDKLTSGYYTVIVRAVLDTASDTSEGKFSVAQTLLPTGKLQLEEAIDELSIIATSSELKKLKEGSFAERQENFKKYWLAMANGDENLAEALMREYYNRVATANERFSFGKVSGWRTDRGRVYVKYGTPSSVERSQPSFSGPIFEIWNYYNLKKRFIFIDQFQTGDFRLYREE